MSDNLSREEAAFIGKVTAKAARKLKAQREGKPGVWFGFGMSGLIGWSRAVPTLVGAMIGIWWDRRHPGAHSWTLMLLMVGLVLGCMNAWHWMVREEKAMHEEPEKKDE